MTTTEYLVANPPTQAQAQAQTPCLLPPLPLGPLIRHRNLWRTPGLPDPDPDLLHRLHQLPRQWARFADRQVLLELRERAGADDDAVPQPRVERRVVQEPADRDTVAG